MNVDLYRSFNISNLVSLFPQRGGDEVQQHESLLPAPL